VGCFALLCRLHSPLAGWLAVCLLLSCRLLVVLATCCYVDVVLALYVFAAVYAFYLYGKEPESGSRPYLILAALFSGLAAGTKYSGLVYVVLLGGLLLLRRQWRDAFRFAGVTLLCGGGWYLRNVYYAKNPLWPMLSPILGYGPWSADDYRRHLPSIADPSLQRNLLGLLKVPLRLSLNQELGRGLFEVSFLCWLGVLGLLFGGHRRLSPHERLLWAVPAGYTLVWFSSYAANRLYAPNIPLLVVLAALGLLHLGERLLQGRVARRLALVAAVLWALAPAYGWILHDLVDYGPLPATAAAQDQYLARMLPNYRATALAASLPGLTYALANEDATYFGRGKQLGDHFGEARYAEILPHLDQPQALSERLARFSVQNFLIHKTRIGRSVALPPPFRKLYEDKDMVLYRIEPGPDPGRALPP
jgi:hypothetical protein